MLSNRIQSHTFISLVTIFHALSFLRKTNCGLLSFLLSFFASRSTTYIKRKKKALELQRKQRKKKALKQIGIALLILLTLVCYIEDTEEGCLICLYLGLDA